jgi:Flp pilus assembly protein TadD
MVASIDFTNRQMLRMARVAGLAVMVSFAAQLAAAQAVGSSRGLTTGDGNNQIQGRVYFPSNQQGKIVKIVLESTNSVGGASTVTEQDGTFRFNGLRPGNYSVVVDGGKDFETARESVTIDPIGPGRVVQVNLLLRPKIDAANPSFAGVPQAALDLYQKGMAAAQKGNPKSAVELLSKAVETYPNFPQALSDLGAQYLKLSQWEKASETFESLIKLRANDPAAQLDLGIALYNQSTALYTDNKRDEAMQKASQAEIHLREAVKLNAPGPSGHYYLGMALIKLKNYDEARVELEAAIKNGGDGIAMAHRYLGGLYQVAHRNKEAADEFEKFLKLDPKAKDADKIKEMIENLRKGQ